MIVGEKLSGCDVGGNYRCCDFAEYEVVVGTQHGVEEREFDEKVLSDEADEYKGDEC